MKPHGSAHTQGRQCLHCGAPIADHIHKGRKFCEREVLADGSVQSCKDDFNARLRKERDESFRGRTALQKRLSIAIAALYKNKGERVTTDDLDRYEIPLEDALRQEPKGGLFDFYFHHHRLEQLSMTHLKIHPHAHPL